MADDFGAFPPSASAPTRLDLDTVFQTNDDVIIQISKDEELLSRKDRNFWVRYFKDHKAFVQVVATQDMKDKRFENLLQGDVFAREEKGQEGREGQVGVLISATRSRILRGPGEGTVCFVDDSNADSRKIEYEDISLIRLRKMSSKMEDGEFDYLEDCFLLSSLLRTYEEDENVNVYDLSALQEDGSISGKRREHLYEMSAVLCAVMQIVFPLAVGLFVADKMVRDPERQFCPITTGWAPDQILTRILNKITGLLSAIYLGFYLRVQQKHWAEKPTLAMLQRGRIAKVLDDHKWIVLGRTMTVLNLALCGFVSLMVIYEAEDPLDLVLNSLALFFVAEVDELLVRKSAILRSVRLVRESVRKYVKPFKAVKEKKKKYTVRLKSAIKSATRNKDETGEVASDSRRQHQSEPVNTNDVDPLNSSEIIAPEGLIETIPHTLPETAKLDHKISTKCTYHFSKWLLSAGSTVFDIVNIVLVVSPVYIVVCK